MRLLYPACAVLVALAGLLTAYLIHETREPAPTTEAAPGAAAAIGRFVAVPAADFSAVAPLDANGQPADMARYRGKTLLVNLWATWCAPCIEELPSLGKLQQALGGDAFQVVTIAFQESDPRKIEPFLAAHGAGNLPALIDADSTIAKVAKVTALPTSLLVDRDGTVKAMLTGDARWHCGNALAAVKAFIADGTVSQSPLDTCE
ncbi:MAG TPA: TlpA disulfide reductase family protein [Dongiaceae bacterium]|nr:TlpA disulfide reductase family protein [Dongiaceae bacterium]